MTRDEEMRRRQKEVAEIVKKHRAETANAEPSETREEPRAHEEKNEENES